jgi:hypothetical protein
MTDETATYSIDDWLSDWVYETDLLLTHSSGLKVMFYEPVNDPQGLRALCKGDFVTGTVQTSREFMLQRGVSELESVKSTMRLYRQAELLYRTRPAGTPNAPERQVHQ